MFRLFITFCITLLATTTINTTPATPPIEITKKKYELCIASMFQNEASRLKEWIEYHHIAGIEHFYLYNNESNDNWQEVVSPYVQRGLVEIIDWPTLSSSDWGLPQRCAYRDALKKTETISEWLALIDLDEFILPLQGTTISECLKIFFPDATAIYVNWLHFGTGGITLAPEDSMLLKLTACSNRTHPCNGGGKSIVKPAKVNIDNVWTVHYCPLRDGFHYYNVNYNRLNFNNKGILQLNYNHDNRYIQINHYRMGDESYFYNIRLPRQIKGKLSETLLWEHYHAFNQEKDDTIIKFIQTKHPEKYKEFWKKFSGN